jgi:hypothetical protein
MHKACTISACIKNVFPLRSPHLYLYHKIVNHEKDIYNCRGRSKPQWFT